MARADWDGLFRGISAGLNSAPIQDNKTNNPLKQQPAAPNAAGTKPVEATAPASAQAEIAVPNTPPATGLGMLPAQQAAPAATPEGLNAAFAQQYPGAAEGGGVDVQPQGLGALPTDIPAQTPTPTGPAPIRQTAIPTEQPPVQEQQIAVGVTQSDKDAWDVYREEKRQWIFESENTIRRRQGETGVNQFRTRLMEQERRKSVGYSTIGSQALSKGNNQVAAAMYNKMMMAMPIETNTWFEPNQSGGVTAISSEGRVEYGPKEALELQVMAMSTTDGYVQFLNSQQGYETDKNRNTLNREMFDDDKGFKLAKVALEHMRVVLDKEISDFKMESGGYGTKSDIGDLYNDTESFLVIEGQGKMDGAFNIVSFLEDNSLWRKFMDDAIALHMQFPNASNTEVLNTVANSYISKAVGGSGSQ